MDVCHAYCVSFVANQEHVLEWHLGSQVNVLESRDACYRDLQVWLFGLRRVRGMALVDLQFCVHDGVARFGYRDFQQGPEEFHGYGLMKKTEARSKNL